GNLETKAKGESQLAVYALARPLAYIEREQIAPILEGIQNDRDVRSVALYDADGAFVAGNRADQRRVSLDDLARSPLEQLDNHAGVGREIFDKGKDERTGRETITRVGALWIEFSSHYMEERVTASWIRYTLIAGIGVLITMLLLAWVLTRLFAPIEDL